MGETKEIGHMNRGRVGVGYLITREVDLVRTAAAGGGDLNKGGGCGRNRA